MTPSPGHRRRLTTSASLHPYPQRQLSMAFESPVLQDMNSNERAAVVKQLATLLLQAADLQTERNDHDEL